MKIVVIMSIEEHMRAIRKILAERGVPVFSEMEMTGIKSLLPVDERENWFSHDVHAMHSHLFFAVVDEQKAEAVMAAVAAYSSAEHLQNPVHAFQLNVEKFI